jgi:hypothetical protein
VCQACYTRNILVYSSSVGLENILAYSSVVGLVNSLVYSSAVDLENSLAYSSVIIPGDTKTIVCQACYTISIIKTNGITDILTELTNNAVNSF